MAFTYFRKLQFDRTKCGTSNLTNFPVLVSILDATFGSHLASSSGYDIAFATDPAGASRVPWELEPVFNKATGKMLAWVRVGTLNGSAAASNSELYMCYGDPSIVAPLNVGAAAPTAVWDANYKGVWHLGSGVAISLADSTSNGNTLTNSGATAVGGQIAGACAFNPASLSSPAAVLHPPRIAFSAWVKPNALTNSYSSVESDEAGGGNDDHMMAIKSNGKCAVYLASLVNFDGSGSHTLTVGNWYLIGYSYNGSQLIGYVNGAQDAAVSAVGSAPNFSSNQSFGNSIYAGRAFMGLMDEIRVSDAARPADQFLAEYNNQLTPGNIGAPGFVIFGPESRQQQPSALII